MKGGPLLEWFFHPSVSRMRKMLCSFQLVLCFGWSCLGTPLGYCWLVDGCRLDSLLEAEGCPV